MMIDKNAYFTGMAEVLRTYNEAKKERAARKWQIISTNGSCSPEMELWEQENKAAEAAFPYTVSQMDAFWCWRRSVREGVTEFEVDDLMKADDIPGFVKTLREAGIETFVYTDTSTALMRSLHGFAEAGCTMEGLCTIVHPDDYTGGETEDGDMERGPVKVPGVRFRVA